MILSNELAGIRRIFIDTAPIIYYTNDAKLKQIKDIRVLVLKDYI